MILVPPALGYYTVNSPNPKYDPGIEVPCPFCLEKLGKDDLRTLSLMQAERKPHLSVFYRCHKTCHEKAGEEEQNHLDEIVMATLDALINKSKALKENS